MKIQEDWEQPNPFDFKLKDRVFEDQYYKLYHHRLTVLKDRVKQECQRRWDNGFTLNGRPVEMKGKVLDIQGKEPCWAIGTIYCEMKYKPNILEEVINDVYRAPDLTKSYTDPEGSDEIMLEDESGRVLLVGENIKATPFVTGAVIGVLGMEADAGTFQVLDICYPIPVPQKPLNLNPDRDAVGGKRKIAIVSGLNINTMSPGRLLKLQLLQDYLCGNLRSPETVSKIGKLLICGDSVSFNFDDNSSGELVNCLTTLGHFLGNVSQSCPVALMPGAKDPSNRSLPQKPLHKALFSKSLGEHFEEVNRDILSLVTNPFKFHLEGLEILATSGQSINDICKYLIPNQGSSQEEDTTEHRLDLMECTMKWQNIAPTVPDTLWAYPFPDSDPFLLDEWPHVYIVGNQPTYGFRNLDIHGRRIKLISIPTFSSTGDLVLLDLATLETEVINIGA